MAFAQTRSITINHALCGASDSLNFTTLASASDATLKSIANGGHVQDAGGADILFFSDSLLTTQIASEIEFYDPVNGVLVAWVKVGTVSHTVDTVIYVAYGNAAPPARTTNPYDANFVSVWHLANGSVLSGADSVGAHTMTSAGGATAAVGKIDGCGGFGAANGYMTSGAFTLSATPNVFTFSAWCKAASLVARIAVFTSSSAGTASNWFVELGSGSGQGNSIAIAQPGTFIAWTTANTYPNDAAWHHIAISRNGTGNTFAFYVDGILTATFGFNSQDFVDSGGAKGIGLRSTGTPQLFNGSLDEVRYSGSVRTADWILTEYNNQNAPGNIGTPGFLTWGAEVPISSGGSGMLALLGCGS